MGITHAQTVTDVYATQEGNYIFVNYTLETSSACSVSLLLSPDNGITWQGPLTDCTGDVGENISGGQKQIKWNVLASREQLVGKGYQFKIITDEKEEEIKAFVSEEPVYPGGLENMYAEIYKNMTYPEMEKEQSISGTVYVSFVVEKNGNITDVKTERGVTGGPNLSKAAEEAVKKLSNFTPANDNGKSVRYRYRIPIKFTLK